MELKRPARQCTYPNKKLRDGQYDAILIAAAGVEHLELDLSDLHQEFLAPEVFVPAPAQRVLARQTRENDDELLSIIDQITDLDVLVKQILNDRY